MKAIAPGKVILSGEHSVVYGAPAIALAVANHISAEFQANARPHLDVCFDGLGSESLALDRVAALPQQLEDRFQAFLAGKCAVTELLPSPYQLLHYVFALNGVAKGGRLITRSNLPMGSGMGSSAAAIAATQILAEQLGAEPLTIRQRFERVRYCERLQHGRGSAIDAAAVTYGGLVRVAGDDIRQLDSALTGEWYRVDSGRPQVSTGECVQAVRQNYAESQIWSEFSDVSEQLISALQQGRDLTPQVRANHRLLQQIGVVPAQVSAFIAEVEALGGAAKISGAGAHRGECGGLVLVSLPETELETICARYGYGMAPLQEDRSGARIITD